MTDIAKGFFLLFRGWRAITKTRGALRFALIPVVLNLAIFGLFVVALVVWILPWLVSFTASIAFSAVLKVIVWVATLLLVLIAYAFLFPMIAEVIGAPFYEEIGVRIDKEARRPIVERAWYVEVKLAVDQEARKLVVVVALSFLIFVLQFAPVIGQGLSVAIGFAVLVLTLGADSVRPALARRGLMLSDRRKWVLAHLRPVVGMGLAKALGLIVPVLNIVVLPMAAAGGTILVQEFDE